MSSSNPLGAIDQLMQSASQALAAMDYLNCETQCEQALTLARQQRDWSAYARVLLPLQEVRRQRRMIAAEGAIRLGSASLSGPAKEVLNYLERHGGGCLVLTDPHTEKDANALLESARNRQIHIELLWAVVDGDSAQWALRTFAGQDLEVTVDAPPSHWQDQWLLSGQALPPASDAAAMESQASLINRAAQPADWFIDASEALGNAGLELAATISDPRLRLATLEDCIEGVPDHELLHQRLAQTARTLQSASAG